MAMLLLDKDCHFRAALTAILDGDQMGALKRDQRAAFGVAIYTPPMQVKIGDEERIGSFEAG